MSKKATKITVFKDAVKVRGINKSVTIVRRVITDIEKQGPAKNVIHLKSLVAETTAKPGVASELSKNGKIKYTWLGLTDEAMVELFVALRTYFSDVEM